MRGNQDVGDRHRRSMQGLSPRMRGNREPEAPAGRGILGSIPAHAGEPSCTPRPRKSARVYPRACGGTKLKIKHDPLAEGLSPRMRGNPLHHHRHLEGRGGLSPRMRGNLPHPPQVPHDASGSIPAHAGEPRAVPVAWGVKVAFLLGLSPRMRGNLTAVASKIDDLGSIPAHAGEPSQQPPSSFEIAVGSIPAHAGEPSQQPLIVLLQWGLSPRMRGNLVAEAVEA